MQAVITVPSVSSVSLSGSNWNYSQVEFIFLCEGYPQSTDAINRVPTPWAMNCHILCGKGKTLIIVIFHRFRSSIYCIERIKIAQDARIDKSILCGNLLPVS